VQSRQLIENGRGRVFNACPEDFTTITDKAVMLPFCDLPDNGGLIVGENITV
jgi:hypothetical protein